MLWQITSPPDSEPLTYAQCKQQARLDGDAERDWITTIAMPAVRAACELECQISLVTRTITATAFAGYEMTENMLALPRGPVQSITSVTAGGSVRDPSLYTLERRGLTDLLALKTAPIFPVVVTYVAGYGEPAAIPPDLTAAMLAHFCWLYENRSADAQPTALDRFYRRYRSFGG